MMTSEAREILFVHVPKAAGTSVKAALRSGGFDFHRLDTRDVQSGFYKRGTAARLQRLVGTERWREGFKFAVCRNPYDRIVSGWNFCRDKANVRVPFDYFVRNLGTYRGYFIEWHCAIPQRTHVEIDGAPAVDHVCRFEYLDEDFDVVRRQLGRPDLPLPHLNQAPHAPYREHFTRELQDIAFECFAGDFEYFGYGYDL